MPPATFGLSSMIPSESSTQKCKVPEQQEQVDNNTLRKYILHDTQLLQHFGWNEFIHQHHRQGDFGDLTIPHLATHLLCHLGCKGAPILFTTPPWDHQCIYAVAIRGPHKSTYEYQDFLCNEMVEMILHHQWIILPYNQVKDLLLKFGLVDKSQAS